MKPPSTPRHRVLGFDPITKGFGFVVLESDPLLLVDWGTRYRNRTPESLGRAVRDLALRYEVDLVVMEDRTFSRSAVRKQALAAVAAIVSRALPSTISLRFVAASEVRAALPNARTKLDRVRLLSESFPELRAKVPPHRYIWQSEDVRWATFDALALVLTSYSLPALASRARPHLLTNKHPMRIRTDDPSKTDR